MNHLVGLAALLGTLLAGNDVHRLVLENGLRCVFRPVAGADRVALLVLFDVGESHDPVGKSGLSHLAEHLYVSAAAGDVSPQTAEEFFARYQGQANAQTGLDYTVIAAEFERSRLREEIHEAAQRMGSLRVVPADLERELPRLEEELANMYGGLPHLALKNGARAAAVPLPPGARRGGVIEHVEGLGVEFVAGWLQQYYRPPHVQLVVVGGFDLDRATEWVEQEFASIPAAGPLPERHAAGAPSTNHRHVLAKDPVCAATMAIAVPAADSADYPAFLCWLARLQRATMGGNTPGDPYARLQYSPLDDPSVLYFTSKAAVGSTEEQLRAQLQREFGALLDRPGSLMTDRMLIQNLYGSVLGLGPLLYGEQSSLYFAALVLGRLGQCSRSPDELREALLALTEQDLVEARGRIFAEERAGYCYLGASRP